MSQAVQAQSKPSESIPPFPPPDCKGDIKYTQVKLNQKCLYPGYLLTNEAVSCLINKYNWCVESWIVDIDYNQKKCDAQIDIEKNLYTSSLDLVKKTNSLCEENLKLVNEKLEKSQAWYRNPWLWSGVGFVVGAVVTGTVVYLVVK